MTLADQPAAEWTVTLKIRRFDPDVDERPHLQRFTVPARPTDTVLSLLQRVRDYQDGTLGFRGSCEQGDCGADAVRINGANRLACTTLAADLADEITVEPVAGLPVQKDLIVDMEPFFASVRAIQPYLSTHGTPPSAEYEQSAAERARIAETSTCNLCAACTTACPVYWTDDAYAGPAAIVTAHRFIFDSRDDAGEQRLEILDGRHGVWRCRTTFNCTDACPRGIEVTGAIAEVKRAALGQ
jgi:succinate dehydrogenase / fumarate reductase iron-sulfur subunit